MSAALILGGASLAAGLFNKPKGPNLGAINSKYMGMSPAGYLSPEDLAFGGLQQSRGNEAVGAAAGQYRQRAFRNLAARGISGPADAQVAADAGQSEALGRVGVARNVSDLLNSRFNRNQDFEREKMFKAWGLDAGQAVQNEALNRAGQSEFWNSQMEFLPRLLEMNNKQGLALPGAGSGTRTEDVGGGA